MDSIGAMTTMGEAQKKHDRSVDPMLCYTMRWWGQTAEGNEMAGLEKLERAEGTLIVRTSGSWQRCLHEGGTT